MIGSRGILVYSFDQVAKGSKVCIFLFSLLIEVEGEIVDIFIF
ncbi:Uncharacterised protein [Streptococcus pneumoniae]|nr:Uncharacterised protein [Streptococcus pneumoniae]CJH81481.1 Uncharacterised protein [Streptococcus pneumoniae]